MAEGLIIIPTFNESENIDKLLRNVFSLQRTFAVLVVDDGSPDGTADIVKQLQSEFNDRLFLMQREKKTGLGRAYIDGFKWALERDFPYIFEMDADFSHNPNDLIRLHNCCVRDGYQMVIGSRYITGVNVVNWPMSRVLLSWGLPNTFNGLRAWALKTPQQVLFVITAVFWLNLICQRLNLSAMLFKLK